jgi:DNA mismatch endonuclease, patch repair protein
MRKNSQKLPSPPKPTSAAVSATMRGNRSRDTRPELAVRRLLFGLGYRYQLHRRDMPGCPDIVFPRRRKVVFIHGCFWHQHSSQHCPLRTHPKTNLDYWKTKLAGNRGRDRLIERTLAAMNWRVMILWECEIRSVVMMVRRLRAFLGPKRLRKMRRRRRENSMQIPRSRGGRAFDLRWRSSSDKSVDSEAETRL